MTDWLPIVSGLYALTLVGIFAARHWIIAHITKGVQHGFDKKIEEMRSQFRESEERLKSRLRTQEAEFALLRTNAFAGRANRQALFDRRRFKAVEKVWTATNELAILKSLSGIMAALNFSVAAKQASDPEIQQFLTAFAPLVPDKEKLKERANIARDERPFVPELAWAYFQAYSSILYGSLVRFTVLKTGIDNPGKLLEEDGVRSILKAALPHRVKFIDDNEFGRYHFLLEEIEGLLLSELRKILDGKKADEADVERATGIMNAVKRVEQERSAEIALNPEATLNRR